MKHLAQIITLISATALIIVVLMQNQGSSLGSGFGGETNFYRSRRGLEKMLFYATIVLAVIFVGSIIAALIIK